ncbi:uncharacterized protein V6R79_005489 [Siganus canaliculatus]
METTGAGVLQVLAENSGAMMPPVSTASSSNYDYDYDAVQPYFLPSGEDEDFYPPPRRQLLPAPGEDIWKKFELLPTPPLSPSRRSSLPDVPPLCELLDDACGPSAAFLQSFIIQDCMWSSSFAAATELQKLLSERLASLHGRRDSAPAADAAGEQQEVGGAQVTSGYLHDLHTAAVDCVDPSAVFPCSTPPEKSRETAESCLRLETPPLSSSSESEEEEQEEEHEEEHKEEEHEEEEESEVDVVTVDQWRTSRRSGSAPLVLKRSHVNIQQHNYAAQRPSLRPQRASKRLKADGARGGGGGGGGGVSSCSPRSTDGEDGEDRRRTHNVLERQRRNELKISFTALRDQVPALAHNRKAAKVLILSKATEFISEVRDEEARLLRTKDELRKTSRDLKLRLEQLRTLQ